MLKRIAIMGTGSLGTILGTFIARRRQIDLIDANQLHVDALNRDGATVGGTVKLEHIPVHAITPEQMDGKYDLYIYMAKQTANGACLPLMKKHADERTCVCCCQNGLPEQAVCGYFPEERVFGAPVGWGATWLKPGCSELTTSLEQQYFTLGSVSGAVTPELLEVKEILETMCRVELSENLLGQRWTKLHINTAYSGLATVMGGTFGDVSAHELAIKWAVRVGRECINICKARGIQMIPGHLKTGREIDFMELYSFASPEEEKRCIDTVRDMNEGSRMLVPSMLQDLRKGLACEVEAIVGVVVEAGMQAGVPTPYTGAVLDVIRKKAAGEIPVERFPIECFPESLPT